MLRKKKTQVIDSLQHHFQACNAVKVMSFCSFHGPEPWSCQGSAVVEAVPVVVDKVYIGQAYFEFCFRVLM